MTETPRAEPAAPDADRRFLSGVALMGGAKWVAQVGSWLSTIVVARLLSPEDYGLVGICLAYMGLAQLVSEFGIATAITSLREFDADELRQLNSVALGFALVAMGLSLALARPLGWFFGSPELSGMLAVLSGNFVWLGLQSVPTGTLQREFRYRELAAADAARSIVMAGLAVTLAVAGLGAWALVWAQMGGQLVAALLLVHATRRGFARPSMARLRPALTLSGQVVISRLSWYTWSNADFVVAGRLLGTAPLGAYTLAWNIASAPVEKITSVLLRVTIGFFAGSGTSVAELRRRMLLVSEGLSMVTFPLAVGLACTADLVVPVVFGDKWSEAVPALRILALVATVRSLTPVVNQVLIRSNQAGFEMWRSIWLAVLMPAGFVIGARWGIVGIATVWIVLFPVISLLQIGRAFATLQLSAAEFARRLSAPAASCLVMALVVMGLRRGLEPAWGNTAQLVALVFAGALTYAACMWWMARERVRSLLRKFRPQPA